MRGIIAIALFAVALFAIAPIATGVLPDSTGAFADTKPCLEYEADSGTTGATVECTGDANTQDATGHDAREVSGTSRAVAGTEGLQGNAAVGNALNSIVNVVVPLALYGGGIALLVFAGFRLSRRRMSM